MSKEQFERARILAMRESELRLLQAGAAGEDPRYVIHATGLLLQRWPAHRDPRRNYRLRPAEPEYFGA